jgi:hypothetical protein
MSSMRSTGMYVTRETFRENRDSYVYLHEIATALDDLETNALILL